MSWADGSDEYARNHGYYVYFTHIPTGRTANFKAWITDFDDTYDSEWNDVNVYGRMDPISTFQGTRRTINFSFDVIAGDLEQAKENFVNSRRLIQFLYPVYGQGVSAGDFSATSLQASPLLKLRFINLIGGPGEQALVGKLSGLSYKPDFDMGVFDGAGKLLPKLNRFDCSYTVFHTEPLGYAESGHLRSPRFPYYTEIDGEDPLGTDGPPDPDAEEQVTTPVGFGTVFRD